MWDWGKVMLLHEAYVYPHGPLVLRTLKTKTRRLSSEASMVVRELKTKNLQVEIRRNLQT